MFDILVYGADNNNGLSLIRSLGKVGLRVLVIARNSDAIGIHSMYTAESLVMPTFPPSAKYLNNLAKYRKIKYIIAHEQQDIIYLSGLAAQGHLNDLILIAHPIEIINRLRDENFKNNLIDNVGLKFDTYNIIDSFETFEEYLQQAHYPIIFYTLDQNSQKYQLRYARNFIDFRRKVRDFLKNKQPIKVLKPQFHHHPVYEDYYFISNKEIKYVWKSKSFLQPFNPLYQTHSVSCFHQRKNTTIDKAMSDIFQFLHIDNDILGIKYFMHDNQAYCIDIDVTITPHNLPLLNKMEKNLSLLRLASFGLNFDLQHTTQQTKNLLYISGEHLFTLAGTITDPVLGVDLTLKDKSFYNPLFDYHDIKPTIMTINGFIVNKFKNAICYIRDFIMNKFEQLGLKKRVKIKN